MPELGTISSQSNVPSSVKAFPFSRWQANPLALTTSDAVLDEIVAAAGESILVDHLRAACTGTIPTQVLIKVRFVLDDDTNIDSAVSSANATEQLINMAAQRIAVGALNTPNPAWRTAEAVDNLYTLLNLTNNLANKRYIKKVQLIGRRSNTTDPGTYGWEVNGRVLAA